MGEAYPLHIGDATREQLVRIGDATLRAGEARARASDTSENVRIGETAAVRTLGAKCASVAWAACPLCHAGDGDGDRGRFHDLTGDADWRCTGFGDVVRLTTTPCEGTSRCVHGSNLALGL